MPCRLMRRAVRTIQISRAALPQQRALSQHVGRHPEPNAHVVKACFIHPLFHPIAIRFRAFQPLSIFIRFLDREKRIGPNREDDAFLFQLFCLRQHLDQVSLHVLLRVLARPDRDGAMVHRLLAAVDPFFPLGNEDEHHFGLRAVPCDSASIEGDLDVEKILPAVPSWLHAHTPHSDPAGVGRSHGLHDSACLHLHGAPEADAVTVRRLIQFQVMLDQSHNAFLCAGHLIGAGKAVPEARLVENLLHPTVSLD